MPASAAVIWHLPRGLKEAQHSVKFCLVYLTTPVPVPIKVKKVGMSEVIRRKEGS